ncbi:MAG TPA: hypothetical protein VGI40_16525 [Pirellulaceae bacterium]|jgi:hypothetical protein
MERSIAREINDDAVTPADLGQQYEARLAQLKADIEEGLRGNTVPSEEVFAKLRATFEVRHSHENPYGSA